MKRNFTKLLFITALAVLSVKANAQTDSVKVKGMGKNLIKVSLTSLALNTYSFSYERKIGRKISLGIGYRVMPEGELPFKSNLESIIDDPETFKHVDGFRTGNTAITPEIKFYFGKGVFRGFYIAPFARFAKYTAKLPSFEYEFEEGGMSQTEQIPLNGELKTTTGGLLFGAQWKLSKLIYLDWSILGPQYGSSKGFLKGTKTLSEDEQEALREELEDLEIPLVDSEVTVDASGARVDFDGPWAGIRASIGLAFRF
ncbi:DUF3575 domain-containing protein [Paradesertivirga mongoliensis]|uniref:DUF3575 domain-containing protein n=1 Tax=Paradesertivirga mongoliensis TaxID=2100740 RepID=A0ABW4ZHU5_9SPHI|nr:DUF3575 domain-containing protein [Pedobacter mongoliensis]